jgi:energy-converting hydrogenase A subunit M
VRKRTVSERKYEYGRYRERGMDTAACEKLHDRVGMGENRGIENRTDNAVTYCFKDSFCLVYFRFRRHQDASKKKLRELLRVITVV